MKLSLSVRVAESAKRKDVADLPIEALAPLAKAAGFQALSMRASVVSVTSPPARVQAVKQVLAREGLTVSMVTGDIPLAANNAQATDAIRNIGPYLDLAEALDCRLVRVMTQHESDIAQVQRAADIAAEHNLTLAHMTHWGTLIETVEDALRVVRAVNRPNFGVVYEAANTMACTSNFDPEAVRQLVPHLVNVMFQNVHKDPASPIGFRSNRLGQVGLRYVPLADRSVLDAEAMVVTLREAGYDGWLTVHQPLRDGQTVPDAITEAAAVFGPFIRP
jgi:sugar phosphate isomerase/epimerase